MTTVGIIGSGQIGSALAQLAVEAGHQVVLSNSRGPETLAEIVAELGPRASAAASKDVAAAGDIVVVTVPVSAFPNLPAAGLAGKTVIDTCNYGPERDGHIAELDDGSSTSSELLQAHLPESHVVKAFNNIYFDHLATLTRATGDPERSVLAIAGNDEDAKKQVTALFDDLGYDAYDVGPLSEGWRYQRDTAAYAGLYATGDEWPGTPRQVTPELLKEKLDAAVRYADM